MAHIILTRRNIYTLLSQLEIEGSSKVLHKPADDGGRVAIRVCEDADYYQTRKPSQMSPEHEKFIARCAAIFPLKDKQ